MVCNTGTWDTEEGRHQAQSPVRMYSELLGYTTRFRLSKQRREGKRRKVEEREGRRRKGNGKSSGEEGRPRVPWTLNTNGNQVFNECVGGFYTSCPGTMEYCNLLFFFLNFTIVILCVSAFVCMYIASSGCRECIAFSGLYRQAGTRQIWHILTPLGGRA